MYIYLLSIVIPRHPLNAYNCLLHIFMYSISLFFFLNAPAPTEFYPLPLPDALRIFLRGFPGARAAPRGPPPAQPLPRRPPPRGPEPRPRLPRRAALVLRRRGSDRAALPPRPHPPDRKSTRLNSSHLVISYAVFCLKK